LLLLLLLLLLWGHKHLLLLLALLLLLLLLLLLAWHRDHSPSSSSLIQLRHGLRGGAGGADGVPHGPADWTVGVFALVVVGEDVSGREGREGGKEGRTEGVG